MKRFFSLLLIILITTLPVLAHPGRLDSNGGHWDRKNGTYHYHSGTHSSGNSNSITPSPTNTPIVTVRPKSTATPTPTKAPQTTKKQSIVPLLLLGYITLLVVFDD